MRLVTKITLIAFGLAGTLEAVSQNQDSAQWDTAADRAKGAPYLSDFEKEIVKEINKARTDPARYA